MTVIREKQNYKYPSPISAPASDTESLNLGSLPASDTESIVDEPPRILRVSFQLPVHGSKVEEVINNKKKFGKRKWRRYQNGCFLADLDEDEEDKYVVMEAYKSRFTRLFEDKVAMDCWNSFIEKSEEEQSRIMRRVSESFSKKQMVDSSELDSPGRISARIRRTLKIKKNLQFEMIEKCEKDLLGFFEATPKDTYIKFPPTSFERLLIHAIAQYHNLKSISVIYGEEARRSVEVYNIRPNWSRANCRLADFIKKIRSKNESR